MPCSCLVTVRALVYLSRLQNIDMVSISRYLVNIVSTSCRNWNPDIESSLVPGNPLISLIIVRLLVNTVAHSVSRHVHRLEVSYRFGSSKYLFSESIHLTYGRIVTPCVVDVGVCCLLCMKLLAHSCCSYFWIIIGSRPISFPSLFPP